MAKRKIEEHKVDTSRWLLTYADMMNNLLILFIVLYSISVMDLQKFKAIAQKFSTTFTGSASAGQAAAASGTTATLPDVPETAGENQTTNSDAQQFNDLYETMKKEIAKTGYADSVVMEKDETSINFRFKDNVLFYPDSPKMKESGNDVLLFLGSTIKGVNRMVESVSIGGHTAKVSAESTSNFFSWELSSDRALTVLKFFVQQCGLPQSKMTATGYSCYKPVASNSTEDGRALNRRVEIKVSRKLSEAEKSAAQLPKTQS